MHRDGTNVPNAAEKPWELSHQSGFLLHNTYTGTGAHGGNEAFQLASVALSENLRASFESSQPTQLSSFASMDTHADYGLNTAVKSVVNTSAVGTTGNFVNQDINGLLVGTAWNASTLTYSFPTAASNYGAGYGSGDPDAGPAVAGFQALSTAQDNVIRYALGLVSQYTSLTFNEITETDSTHATLRFAGSSYPNTSFAYYPADEDFGGDAFYGNIRNDAPTKAGYAFDTFMHELGHALGLKHGQEPRDDHGVLPENHNSTEWSIMDYYSYVGNNENTYDNEEGSGNQTYMVDDISALQYIYGANFNTNSGNTKYTWNQNTGEMSINGVGQGASSTNTIYEAIWDGNGTDTYNLANYTTSVKIDLRPGEWSTFSSGQLALLDYRDHSITPPGNIDNANLYNDDPRSLIENATGGGGNDVLTGNAATNVLTGNAGNDRFLLHEANLADGDKYIGGSGIDTFDISQIHPAAGGVIDLAHGKWTIGANHETLNAIENVNGSSASETIDGSTTKNLLAGNNGNDKIIGNSGNDTLQGGAGKDFLTGGAGADKLSGGVGTDHFIYTKITESITSRSGRDTISDFSDAQKDRIDLHLIDANATHRGNQKFDFIGKSNFSHHADELRYSVDAHGNVTIQADVNGDGKSDFTVTLAHISHVVGGDFIL